MITAILLAFYRQRVKYVKQCIEVLKNGGLKPDKIIVVSNNEELDFNINGVTTITASENLGAGIRFGLALSIPSDYYFFIDDDMIPDLDTISNFMKYADEDCCLGQCGKKLEEGKKYSEVSGIWSEDKKIDVDLLVGVGGIFCSYKALTKMMVLQEKVRKAIGYDFGRETDLLLSMPNKPILIPVTETSKIRKLPFTDTGLCLNKIHGDKRDEATKIILENL